MIRFQQLALRRGEQLLFSEAEFSIHGGWRCGLIGHNGTGKSSLFALLRGELLPDVGDASIAQEWRVAHMSQEVTDLTAVALDYVLVADQTLQQLEQQIVSADDDTDPLQLAAWHEAYAHHEGYTAKARAQSLLAGLGFSQMQMQQKVGSFSGGWRIRLNLARTLFQPSELLLLDEPTNHLDLETVLWLQDFLRGYAGTLMLISHDRDFLDAVCTHTIHLYQQKLTLYTGNYSSFERQRAERLAIEQAMREKQQSQRAHLEDFVRRFRAKATKAKQAQSRLKALERMPLIQLAHVDSPFSFTLPAADKLSVPLLSIKFANMGHAEHLVLKQVNFSLQPGQRIGLLGLNGAGKSTLIKSLVGELPLLSGKRIEGEHLVVGYFAQHQLEALDDEASPLLHVQRLSPQVKEQTIRDFLGGFGFAGDDALANVAHFSGGEKARLALALLAWQKPNLLLLDEPTNHLDIDMREALVMALQNFAGAVILVSHDRYLMTSCVDEFWLVDSSAVIRFDGDMDDYAQWLKQRQLQEKQAARPIAATVVDAPDVTVKQVKKQDRKEAAAERERLRPFKQKVQKLEQQMEQLTQTLSELEHQLADGDLYEASQKERLQKLLQQQIGVKQQLIIVEEDWLLASERLEQEMQ